MSRSRRKTNGPPVSLFPFLAVLLCTMGALVILLVAMSHVTRQQAQADSRVAADASADEPPAAQPDERALAAAAARRERLEEVQAASAKLEQQLATAQATLEENHLHLSQIEGHIQRLVDQLRSRRAARAELERTETERYDDRAQAERNLKQLHRLIADVRDEIKQAQAEQAGRQKSFAIVPYTGRNGTQRRPVYIECTADAAILQPEGLELTPADFQPPLGVGNPLNAALRASREYYARQDPAAGYDPDAEPYPLILIRPEGIATYFKVREAIRSWDSDFGYEFVQSDLNLAFPSPNPALYAAQELAVQHSRSRRALLAQAAPRASGGQRQAGRGGGRLTGGAGAGAGGAPGLGGAGGGSLPYDAGVLDRVAGGAGGGDSDSGPNTYPSGRRLQGGLAGAANESRGAVGAAEAAGDQITGVEPGGGGGTQPGGTKVTSAGAGGGPSQQAALASPTSGATTDGSPSGGAAGQPSEPPSTDGKPVAGVTLPTPTGSGAPAVGAVSQPSPGAIAIRRPISVLVEGDRLVLSRDGATKTIPIQRSTTAAARELVAAMQNQITSWGFAGQGLYWRPVLKLRVSPGGGGRAQELSRLLSRSGIDITFEQTAAAPSTGGVDATR
ncbi:MAG: hypothetical protein AAGB00_08970 [Planctomycetota bacterium]